MMLLRSISLISVLKMGFREYLKMALKPQYFNNMAIVIGIDFDSPTTIMKSLENWFQLLMELSDQFIPQLPMEKQDAMREKCKTFTVFIFN
jgi:hypothetical protein